MVVKQTIRMFRLGIIIRIIKSIIVKIEVIIYFRRMLSKTTQTPKILETRIHKICQETIRTEGDRNSKIKTIRPLRKMMMLTRIETIINRMKMKYLL